MEEEFKALEATGLFRWLLYRQGDIPVCNTRIIRAGRGLPWNRRIAIHPLKEGKLEMREIP